MKAIQLPTTERVTCGLLPDPELTRGRALRVLARTGFAAGIASSTFNHYAKFLREPGVPLACGEIGAGSGKPARCSFEPHDGIVPCIDVTGLWHLARPGAAGIGTIAA